MQITNRFVIGTAVQVVAVAIVMAAAMTACASLVSLNPNTNNPTALQIVLFILNLPALIIWMGGGENDKTGILFRICVFVQWLVIGGGIGLLLALVRRALKRV
jgi:hypothetical protein